MKTDRSSRRIVRIRGITAFCALAAVVGSELWLGASLPARVDRTTARQVEAQTLANVGISDLIVAAR